MGRPGLGSSAGGSKRRPALAGLASLLLACGGGAGVGVAEDGGDATSDVARSDGPGFNHGQGDAGAPDTLDSPEDATVFDATTSPEGTAPTDASPEDVGDADGSASGAFPLDGAGLAPDGGVPCRLSSDCADAPATFCQKDSCDPSVIGTCAVIPGTRETGFCSQGDAGFVCGCDGNTYPYACIAHAQQINVAAQGPCPLLQDGGTCSTNADCPSSAYCKKASCGAATGTCEGEPNFQVCFSQTEQSDGGQPACGCDHQQYSSDCEAASYGINVDFEGTCPPLPSGPCASQADCGGASYANLVYCSPTVCGQPAGVCTPVEGACPVSSFGDSVCGCDGKSYVNECTLSWARVGVAYGGACRSGAIVPCSSSNDCAAGRACIPDPRVSCTGLSCPGVCVTGDTYGQGLEADGGVFFACPSRYNVLLDTLDSRSACDGGPCPSCGFSTGSCDGAGSACPGNASCQVTGCTATGCSTWYCVETVPNCVVCAYTSPESCDASTPCPSGQLCIPAAGCDGGSCPGACVVP